MLIGWVNRALIPFITDERIHREASRPRSGIGRCGIGGTFVNSKVAAVYGPNLASVMRIVFVFWDRFPHSSRCRPSFGGRCLPSFVIHAAIVIIVSVGVPRDHHLPGVAEAHYALGLEFCSCQRRAGASRPKVDNRNDDQQLNQGEGGWLFVRRGFAGNCLFWEYSFRGLES